MIRNPDGVRKPASLTKKFLDLLIKLKRHYY